MPYRYTSIIQTMEINMNHLPLQKLMGIVSLLLLLLAGCGPAAALTPVAAPPFTETSVPTISVPTSVPTMTWLGMQYPTDTWHAETVEENFLFYGLLTHVTLPHCQIMILAEPPTFILDKVPEFTSYESRKWQDSSSEEKTTDRLKAYLVTVKDEAGQEQLVYYEVLDKTGFFGYDDYRLGYFLVSRSSPDPLSCATAFWDVLITLQVDQWTPLPVGQG
jgi:hypothetical protein